MNIINIIQFLNSVLNSIGGDGTSPTLPFPRTTKPESIPNGSNHGREQNREPTLTNNNLSNKKRKAESELPKMNCKASKDSKGSGPSSGVAAPDRPRLLADLKRPSAPTSSKQAVPYRGTSTASSASARPTTPASEAPKAAPKKGSYAEIMARAKAAQTASSAVGVIKHKPKEKVSEKKELLLAKKGLSAKGKNGPKPRQHGGSPDSKSSSPAPRLPTSKKSSEKKLAQPAYKGTAKPVPAYRGTMKAVPSTASSHKITSRAHSSTAKSRHDRHASSEDDIIDDEEIEEDEDDYPESESDMEAGFSDVEEEEQMAVKAAKKEDNEQARIEDQHKREKEDRRRMLQQMAKNAKKRSY